MTLRLPLAFFASILLTAGSTDAALSMAITEFTQETMVIEVSGTIDSEVNGYAWNALCFTNRSQDDQMPGSDWFSVSPSLQSGKLTINGVRALFSSRTNDRAPVGDSIIIFPFTSTDDPIPAGTVLNGSITLTLEPGQTFVHNVSIDLSCGVNEDGSLGPLEANATGFYMLPATAVAVVDGNSAQLKGTVDTAGHPAVVTFEYGKTSAYGSSILAHNAFTSSDAATVQTTLEDLDEVCTYHYRVVAENGPKKWYGSDVTFETGIGVHVKSVSDSSTVAGDSVVHTVVLDKQSTSGRSLPVSVSGNSARIGVDTGLISEFMFSNGVTYTDGKIHIPAGIRTFTVSVPTHSNSEIITRDYTLTVEGSRAIGRIYCNYGHRETSPQKIDASTAVNFLTMNNGSNAIPYYYNISEDVRFDGDVFVGKNSANNYLTLSGSGVMVTVASGKGFTIGGDTGASGNVTVKNGAILAVGGDLAVGAGGSGLLTIDEDSLVMIDGDLSTGKDSQIRLYGNTYGAHGGYLAIAGNYSESELLDNLDLLVFDGSGWVPATASNLLVVHFDGAVNSFSGTYLDNLFGVDADLSGYTVVCYSELDPTWAGFPAVSNYQFTSPWYGKMYYEPDYGNYIYSITQGWQYVCPGSTAECSYFWDMSTSSWWFSAKDFFPWIYWYHNEGGSWYCYLRGTAGQRVFYSSADGREMNESEIVP